MSETSICAQNAGSLEYRNQTPDSPSSRAFEQELAEARYQRNMILAGIGSSTTAILGGACYLLGPATFFTGYATVLAVSSLVMGVKECIAMDHKRAKLAQPK